MKQCSAGINYGYDRCSRNAVVEINGIHYCKQHGIKKLPRIKTVPGTGHRDNLRQNLINIIFEHDHPR